MRRRNFPDGKGVEKQIDNRKQVQPDGHIFYQKRGGIRMDLERIVAILIHLLEDQEGAKIDYRIIPPEEKTDQKEPA